MATYYNRKIEFVVTNKDDEEEKRQGYCIEDNFPYGIVVEEIGTGDRFDLDSADLTWDVVQDE